MNRILALIGLSAYSFMLLAQYPGQYPNQAPPQQPQSGDVAGQPVARLGVLNGEASIQHGDAGEWMAAVVNTPLAAGDAISLPPGSRAELELDNGNFIRVDGDSELRIAAFDGTHAQILVSRGGITWRALRDSPLQIEVSTQVVAVHPLRLSAVRIEAASDGSTRVTVRHGEAEASTPRGTERVHEGSTMLIRGATQQSDAEYQIVSANSPDAWDAWNDQRDAYLQRAQSNRYVSPDIPGAEDLDAAGRWGYDPAYGNVWTPDVPQGWAPYQNGEWVASDPYGWTWVDSAPWGWAPFHYGSWYFRTGFGWSWYPGSRFGHYWYRPAMVGFFGFGANIGWVPLAPFEPFHRWYGPGIGVGAGFGRVGVVGAYRNAGFATGLAVADFQRGAFAGRFTVNRAQLAQATVVHGALPVTPSAANRRLTARATTAAGPRNSFSNQQFFSRGNMASRPTVAPPATGWQRFGQTPSARPQGGPQGGAGWDRFGSANRPPAPGAARSLQVAPPIMQQRPPAYSGGRPGPPPQARGGGGGRAPSGNGQRR